MKKVLILFSIAAFIFSCSQEKGYVIQGELPGAEGTVYLQQRIDGVYENLDSAEVVEGVFEMKGTVELPEDYLLSMGPRDKALIFLDNANFTVKADTSIITDAKIEGGADQSLYNEYNTEYNRQYDYLIGEYQKARGLEEGAEKEAIMTMVDSLYEVAQQYQEDFMKLHTGSPVAAYILTRIQYGKDGNELDELLGMLDESLAATNAYKSLSKRVEALKKVAIGATAPDFTQNDVDGNPVKFSDIYSANKLTLVDFWASWCGPCRQENPNVVAAFKKFSDKGFMVFGVSLDQSKERWLQAIEDDGLTWQHVSDLQGWGNVVAKDYAVNSIPASFMVDANGTIVAANARGEDLHKKIEEFLGE